MSTMSMLTIRVTRTRGPAHAAAGGVRHEPTLPASDADAIMELRSTGTALHRSKLELCELRALKT